MASCALSYGPCYCSSATKSPPDSGPVSVTPSPSSILWPKYGQQKSRNEMTLNPSAQYRISPNGGRSNSLEVKYFFLAFMCGKWSEKRVGTHFGAYYWVPRSLERVSFSALASAGERGNGIADSYESSTLLWYFFWAKFILGDENTIVKRHKYDKKIKYINNLISDFTSTFGTEIRHLEGSRKTKTRPSFNVFYKNISQLAIPRQLLL